jgi:general stress protein CsbA
MRLMANRFMSRYTHQTYVVGVLVFTLINYFIVTDQNLTKA